jgi:L-threonylcarbamoyladenylate synthase
MAFSDTDEELQQRVESAVQILRKRGVVAIPTDTLYGLAACALDAAAVQRVFALKGRPAGMALPLLLAEAGDIRRYATDIPAVTWRLVERFWPGPLTVVLPKADVVPDLVCGGMDTVALRVPDHRVPRAIAAALGTAITGTSANRSGGPELRTAGAVREEFGNRLDLVIDGGATSRGLASTVLDLSDGHPRILRLGAIAQREIEELSGETLNT